MGNTTYSGGKKTFLVIAVLLTTITSTASSYANNVCLPYFLNIMDAYSFYAFYAAIASVGMMTALPLVGSMSAKFGSKNVIVFGLVAQFVSRVALAFCAQPVLFGVLYCLMGFFGGMYMSAPYSVMAELVTPEERPKYFGYITACSAAGALVGPLLTGMVVDRFGPGPGLLVYVIFAVIPVIAFTAMYPNVKRPGTKFDLPGMFIFVVFVLCLVLWLSLGGNLFPFASALGIGMPVVAVLAIVLLIKRENKIDNPAVPVKMFTYKRFSFTFVVQIFVVAYSTCAAAYGIRYALEVMSLDATISSTVVSASDKM